MHFKVCFSVARLVPQCTSLFHLLAHSDTISHVLLRTPSYPSWSLLSVAAMLPANLTLPVRRRTDTLTVPTHVTTRLLPTHTLVIQELRALHM